MGSREKSENLTVCMLPPQISVIKNISEMQRMMIRLVLQARF